MTPGAFTRWQLWVLLAVCLGAWGLLIAIVVTTVRS